MHFFIEYNYFKIFSKQLKVFCIGVKNIKHADWYLEALVYALLTEKIVSINLNIGNDKFWVLMA